MNAYDVHTLQNIYVRKYIYIHIGEPYFTPTQRKQNSSPKCLNATRHPRLVSSFSAGTARSALSSAGAKGIGDGEDTFRQVNVAVQPRTACTYSIRPPARPTKNAKTSLSI